MDRDDTKEEIKRRADLAAIIQQYVPLTRAGRKLKARCPFHQEKTPSFYVDPGAGFWKCFGCGKGGDVFSFLMEMEGLTFSEAAERLANQLGIPWRTEPVDKAKLERRRAQQDALTLAAEYFRKTLASNRGLPAREYLDRRGILPETREVFGLGYARPEWDGLARYLSEQGQNPALAQEAGLIRARQGGGGYFDLFRNRIMFPITDASGRVLGFGGRTLDPDESAKYINSADTPLFKKGQHVYGLPQARQAMGTAGYVVLVEGYTDVLALHQAGFKQVVAALGTALTEDHVRLLGRYVETVVLCYDADSAGMAATLRNLEVFERAGRDAQVVTLPAGLDPDEMVRSQGLEAWEACLASRVSLAEYQLDQLFAQYRDQGADGLARAATKAVEVLLKVSERTRRDSLLRRAAGLWGARDPGSTAAMQRALLMELRRRLPRQPRFLARRRRDEAVILESLARGSGGFPPGRRLLERDLLATALQDRALAESLFRQVEVSDFGLASHRELAAALHAALRQGVFDPRMTVDSLVTGEAREVAVELLLTPGTGLEEKDIAPAAGKLRSYRGAGGLQPVYEIPQPEAPAPAAEAPAEEDFETLRARITERLARGEVAPDDPDYRRYLQLARRSRGRGAYDFVPPPGQPASPGGPHLSEDEGS